MEIIELENAVKIYSIGEVETRALDGVSLSIEDGEFTTLVGPSGSGKTTMLQLMGCLDKPNSGIVRVNGQDVSQYKANKRAEIRREMIGFIFQFFNLIPTLTVLENVTLPMVFAGMNNDNAVEKGLQLLNLVGLGDRFHHKPFELSGGQQQRVAIARSLANDPATEFDPKHGRWHEARRPVRHVWVNTQLHHCTSAASGAGVCDWNRRPGLRCPSPGRPRRPRCWPRAGCRRDTDRRPRSSRRPRY